SVPLLTPRPPASSVSDRFCSTSGAMIPNALVERLVRYAVWPQADEVPGYSAALFRKDAFGNWIAGDEDGHHTELGWELHHLAPQVSNARSVLAQLRPLHWRVKAAAEGRRRALAAR